MLEFLTQFFAWLNIDPNVIGAYDAFMTGLAAFSFIISGLNKFFKSKGFSISFNEIFGNGKKKSNFDGANVMLAIDFVLLALNALTLFVTIPKDFYVVLLLISIVQIVAIAVSFVGKILVVLLVLVFSIKTIFEGEIGFGLLMILFTALLLLAAAVGALHALLTFNKVLSIVRVLA